jgi:hypothetical protein
MYYDNNNYYIGTLPNCGGLNTGDGQPADVITWNMLSGVDNEKTRKINSLEFANKNLVIPFSDGVTGGIKFSVNSDCPQYENTGSFLCALTEFKRIFGNDISFFNSINVQNMYKFIHGEIINNTPINGAYGGEQGECFTGIGGKGWQYYTSPHLASNVYCITALLALSNNKINIYQNLSGTSPDPNPDPNPDPDPDPNPNINDLSVLRYFFLIVSIICLISLIFFGYLLYFR